MLGLLGFSAAGALLGQNMNRMAVTIRTTMRCHAEVGNGKFRDDIGGTPVTPTLDTADVIKSN